MDQAIIDRIGRLIDAYLSPRERTLHNNLDAARRQFSAGGGLSSGNAAARYGKVGADELKVCAGIIWNAIQRTHAAAGAPVDDSTVRDVQEQITKHVSAAAVRARSTAVDMVRGDLQTTLTDHVAAAVDETEREILAQLNVEAEFYVDELRRIASQPAPGSAAGITIVGNVGALQTGTNAVAHVALSVEGSARLIESLDGLRHALEANTEATPEQRAQAGELAGDLIDAVQAPRPNGPKIAGLFGGLATTVQTVASLRGAWELVRDAAIAAGIGAR